MALQFAIENVDQNDGRYAIEVRTDVKQRQFKTRYKNADFEK